MKTSIPVSDTCTYRPYILRIICRFRKPYSKLFNASQSVPVPRAVEFKMATGCKFLSLTDSRECLQKIHVLPRIDKALNVGSFASFCLKPLQVKCFEHVLNGFDVVAVLPTGYGKSLLFQLLPTFLATKTDNNIVIVVCPLNAIIEDQLKVAKNIGIKAEVLQLVDHRMQVAETLFGSHEETDESDDVCIGLLHLISVPPPC